MFTKFYFITIIILKIAYWLELVQQGQLFL